MGDTGVAVSKWILHGSPDVEPVQGGRRRMNCSQSDTSFEAKSQLRGPADSTSMTEICLANSGSIEWEWDMTNWPCFMEGIYLKGVVFLHLDSFFSLVCETELWNIWVTAIACAASSLSLLSFWFSCSLRISSCCFWSCCLCFSITRCWKAWRCSKRLP